MEVPLSGLALMGFEQSLGSDSPPSFSAVTRYSYSFSACTLLSVYSGSCNSRARYRGQSWRYRGSHDSTGGVVAVQGESWR